MSGFVNTFQLIEDKLADIIRTEFGGYSVYFDDEYLNRKINILISKKVQIVLLQILFQVHNLEIIHLRLNSIQKNSISMISKIFKMFILLGIGLHSLLKTIKMLISIHTQ